MKKTKKTLQQYLLFLFTVAYIFIPLAAWLKEDHTIIVKADVVPTWDVEPTITETPAPLDHTLTGISKEQELTNITVKISHYWPDLGGVNCANFKNGKCISKMASGVEWEKGIDWAIACPKELKLGTKIKVLGKVWTCMDRGGKITKEGDVYWIDMLTEKTPVAYGHEVPAEIIK